MLIKKIIYFKLCRVWANNSRRSESVKGRRMQRGENNPLYSNDRILLTSSSSSAPSLTEIMTFL